MCVCRCAWHGLEAGLKARGFPPAGAWSKVFRSGSCRRRQVTAIDWEEPSLPGSVGGRRSTRRDHSGRAFAIDTSEFSRLLASGQWSSLHGPSVRFCQTPQPQFRSTFQSGSAACPQQPGRWWWPGCKREWGMWWEELAEVERRHGS